MQRIPLIDAVVQVRPHLGSFLDRIIHPLRDPKANHDPSRPFTPPPSTPSKEEQDDDDKDGPNFPMDPVVA